MVASPNAGCFLRLSIRVHRLNVVKGDQKTDLCAKPCQELNLATMHLHYPYSPNYNNYDNDDDDKNDNNGKSNNNDMINQWANKA